MYHDNWKFTSRTCSYSTSPAALGHRRFPTNMLHSGGPDHSQLFQEHYRQFVSTLKAAFCHWNAVIIYSDTRDISDTHYYSGNRLLLCLMFDVFPPDGTMFFRNSLLDLIVSRAAGNSAGVIVFQRSSPRVLSWRVHFHKGREHRSSIATARFIRKE